MRLLLFLFFLLSAQHSFAQGQDTVNKSQTKSNWASFVAKIDIQHASKDGIYLNGYVVNIPYKKLKELNGRTVRISGQVTIVEGIGHYDGGEVRQGRYEDTKHILNPKISVLTE